MRSHRTGIGELQTEVRFTQLFRCGLTNNFGIDKSADLLVDDMKQELHSAFSGRAPRLPRSWAGAQARRSTAGEASLVAGARGRRRERRRATGGVRRTCQNNVHLSEFS